MKKKNGAVEIGQDEDKAMRPRFGKRPPVRAVEEAGAEMKKNPTRQIKKTAKKFGKKKARKQAVAIMLAKARKGE